MLQDVYLYHMVMSNRGVTIYLNWVLLCTTCSIWYQRREHNVTYNGELLRDSDTKYLFRQTGANVSSIKLSLAELISGPNSIAFTLLR